MVTITSDQQVALNANLTDGAGREVEVDPKNPPRWSEDSKETIVTVAEGSDGPKSCVVSAVAPGIAEVSCLDPSSNISSKMQIEVIGAGVTKIVVSAGAVEPAKVKKMTKAEKTAAEKEKSHK